MEGRPHGAMRRKEREITDRAEIETILASTNVMHLALADGDEPFLVPVFFAYDGASMCFHSASAGTKIEILKRNPKSASRSRKNRVLSNSPACPRGKRFLRSTRVRISMARAGGKNASMQSLPPWICSDVNGAEGRCREREGGRQPYNVVFFRFRFRAANSGVGRHRLISTWGETDWAQSYWQAKAYTEQHLSEKCWLFTDHLVSNVYGLPCVPVGVSYPGLASTQMNGTVLIEAADFYSIYPVQAEEVEPFKNIRPTDTIGGSAILVFKGNFDTRGTASTTATFMALRALMNSQLPKAQELSDYAIQLAPQSIYGHYVRGVILAKLGNPSAAISELEYARNLALNKRLDPSLLTGIDDGLQALRGVAVAN